MRVVEFLGVPGSGKSTLAERLAERMPDAVPLVEAVRRAVAARGADRITGLTARLAGSAENRLWEAAYARSTDRFAALQRFVVGHPRLVESILETQQIRVGRDIGQDMTLGWLLNLMARYQLAVEWSGAQWLLVDEGFAQRCLALLAPGYADSDAGLIDGYVESAPRPDVLVVVETPIETCFSRLERVGWSQRLTGTTGETRLEFLENAALVAPRVAARFERLGTEVIWVSGTNAPDATVGEIAVTLSS